MNQIITLTRFAKLLAEKTSYKEEYCEQFASELFKLVKDSLKDDGSVTIKGLGRFMVDDDLELHFMADAALEEVVNAPFECFEAVELDDDLTEEQLAEVDTEEAVVAEEAEAESEMAADVAEIPAEVAEEAEVESEMAVAEAEVDEVTEDVEVEPKVAVAVAEVAAEITEEAEVASEMATAEAEAEPDVAGTKVTEVEETAQ